MIALMARPLLPHEQFERKQILLGALGDGHSLNKACIAAGVTPATVYAWKDGDAIFRAAVDASLVKRPDKAPHRQPIARKAKEVPVEEQTDVIEEICKAIRAGLPLEQSCLLVNVHRGALRQWMIDDEDVAARVNRAQSQNMLWWISKLRQGAEKDWKAALAYLERIFPYLFAETKAIEVSMRPEEKHASSIIDITPEATIKRLTEMTDEDLQKIIGNNV